MLKKVSGQTNLKEIVDKFPQTERFLRDLGIKILKKDLNKSLVEIALAHKIPLNVILNNLGKKLGLEIVWPKIEGVSETYQDNFSKSTGLRKGKPKGIKKIVAVYSGKGGVGKTTLAILIASFLANNGKKAGLLDLDIDCPNVMRALGVEEKHRANKEKKIEPIVIDGMKVISMGAIQSAPNQAIMWRGPVIAKAIEQLFHDADWGALDVLVVDFPPGTGEAPLTFFNIVKPDSVIIVTTPQATSLDDASKAVDLCKKMGILSIGVVENMCGDIFGQPNQIKTEQITGGKYIAGIGLSKELAREKFWKYQGNHSVKFALDKIKKFAFRK